MNWSLAVAQKTGLNQKSVAAVLELLEEGATVPFIARYRKEKTGNLDEVAIVAIRDTAEKLQELEKRRQAILDSLKENGHLTPELEKAVLAAGQLSQLEDLFLPYRPKRRTRATIALEKGLEGLANLIAQNLQPKPQEVAPFISPEKGVEDAEAALAGARDIVAERLSETAEIRAGLRLLFKEKALVSCKKAKGAKDPFEYAEHLDKAEPVSTIPSHRLLALLRGQNEGQLSVGLEVDQAAAVGVMSAAAGFKNRPLAEQFSLALADSWKRLIHPSLENETLGLAKEQADLKAVQVFAENLRGLLLAAPLGQVPVLAVDPGLRTGCKIVALSAQGDLLDHGVIYPLVPYQKVAEAEKALRDLVKQYGLKAVAVGNGTGGRESLDFVRSLNLGLQVFAVSESGASVYSASEVARREFPQQDVTVRGAVSIGRRLMDPLAELVKIDPKAIGVGQYQHDVDQKLLKQTLEDVVVSCVNKVGVDVNTATPEILTYVAGLNQKLANQLVEHRQAKGAFRRRDDFLKIKGFGPKTFEQCAGFLRIRGGDNPLDASGVHPERYQLVQAMAANLGCPVAELVGQPGLRKKLNLEAFVSAEAGKLTLEEIVQELEKPGVDPRDALKAVEFDAQVTEIKHLKEGMILNGIVTNVTAFGAFVDIGVHQDGLVHISQLADTFVKDPLQVVKVGQAVRVKVAGVEPERKRISLVRRGVPQS